MEALKAKVAAMDEKTRQIVGGSILAVVLLVLIIVFWWTPACASAKSCADLKASTCVASAGSAACWPTHTGFSGASGGSGSGNGDVSVCGESQWGFGDEPDSGPWKQCFGGMNSNAHDSANAATDGGWEGAHTVCTDAGARLCTVSELMNEVTRGTGCQHDAEMSWSSEPCSLNDIDGHITVQGGQHRGDEACPDECAGQGWSSGGDANGANCARCQCTPRCAPDSNQHAVRCCADVDTTIAKEKCERYIGYRGSLKPPPPVTNAQNDNSASVARQNAEHMRQCRSTSSCMQLQQRYGGWQVGAKTENVRAGELVNGQHPTQQNGGFGPMTGNTVERAQAGVCADSSHGLGGQNKAGRATNQCWGGTNGGQDGGASIVGQTLAGASSSHNGAAGSGGVDNRISGWSHALSICESVGARLCTVDELLSEITRNTGCSHDCEMVWSSQTSPSCKVNQHVVAQGGLNCGYQICPDECSVDQYIQHGGERSSCMCTPRCADDGESKAVRCCADVFFEASARDVELTANLPHGNCHFDPCVNVACAGNDFTGQPLQTERNTRACDPNLPSCLIHTPHLHGGSTCPQAATSGQARGSTNLDPVTHEPLGNVGNSEIPAIRARSDQGAACNNGVRVCGATSQSTMGWNGEPDRAIDGRHCSEWGEGSCTHTDAGLVGDHTASGKNHGPAWWQVDLGGPVTVTKVDVWHRTGCGDALVDPVTGKSDASACNRRLEGAHVFVSNTPRAPSSDYNTQAPMWSVASCTPANGCSICGVVHDAQGQQPEHIVCGQAPACNCGAGPGSRPCAAGKAASCGPRGLGCRKGTYRNGACPSICPDGSLPPDMCSNGGPIVNGMCGNVAATASNTVAGDTCAGSCSDGSSPIISSNGQQSCLVHDPYTNAPRPEAVISGGYPTRQAPEMGLGAQDPHSAYPPVTNSVERPGGRYVTIAHVHDGDSGHSVGGSSDGWVITICEAKVTGQRTAEHVYNNNGDCSVYQALNPLTGQPDPSREPIQPPPPPAACASSKSCSQLHTLYGGWKERTAFNTAGLSSIDGTPQVCGESDNGLGGCGKNQCFGGTVAGGVDLGAGVIEPPHADAATGGFGHAEKICRQAGARLCTVDELASEVGRGTGCQHDGEMVWSSEPCDPDEFGLDESAHITYQGGLHRGDEACPDECTVGEAHGDCMGGEGYCEQELTRGIGGSFEGPGACRFDSCVGTDSAPGTCAIATPNAAEGGSCDMTGGSAAGSRYPWAASGTGQNECVNGKRICGGWGTQTGGTASSTIGWGGEPNRAIDQDTSTQWGGGTCTHTDAGDAVERNVDGSLHGPAWWQVDLGQGALINHVDLWHRTDCCQDRLEKAGVWVSETSDYTTGVKCGDLSDHTITPEVSVCGQVYGRYVTVAHDHQTGGGSSGGVIVTICEAKVWGVRGRVDTSACRCTPRCAQDSLNMAVRCCADKVPRDAAAACSALPDPTGLGKARQYTGPLKPAIVGGTAWYMYLLYVALAIVAAAALVKLWPLIVTKIPKGKTAGGGGMGEGLAADSGDSIYG